MEDVDFLLDMIISSTVIIIAQVPNLGEVFIDYSWWLEALHLAKAVFITSSIL